MRRSYQIDNEVLDALLTHRVMTIESLADKAGCTPETIRNILRGRRRVRGKVQIHAVSARTVNELAQALKVPADWLLSDKASALRHIGASKESAQFNIRPAQVSLDPFEQAMGLRDDLAVFSANGDFANVAMIKSIIKTLCATFEAQSTQRHGETAKGKPHYRYGESGIIDVGIDAYLNDPCWKYLLHEAGKTFHRYGGTFSRAFYVEQRVYSIDERKGLLEIIEAHKQRGHHAYFVDSARLPADLLEKRNLGICGNNGVAVTDVVQWDLDLISAPREIAHRTDQHEEILRRAFTLFEPFESTERTKSKLLESIKFEEE